MKKERAKRKVLVGQKFPSAKRKCLRDTENLHFNTLEQFLQEFDGMHVSLEEESKLKYETAPNAKRKLNFGPIPSKGSQESAFSGVFDITPQNRNTRYSLRRKVPLKKTNKSVSSYESRFMSSDVVPDIIRKMTVHLDPNVTPEKKEKFKSRMRKYFTQHNISGDIKDVTVRSFNSMNSDGHFISGPVLNIRTRGKDRFLAVSCQVDLNDKGTIDAFEKVMRGGEGEVSSLLTPMEVHRVMPVSSGHIKGYFEKGLTNKNTFRKSTKTLLKCDADRYAKTVLKLSVETQKLIQCERVTRILRSTAKEIKSNIDLIFAGQQLFANKEVKALMEKFGGDSSVSNKNLNQLKVVLLFLRQAYEGLHKISHSLSKSNHSGNMCIGSRTTNTEMMGVEKFGRLLNQKYDVVAETSVIYLKDENDRPQHLITDKIGMRYSIPVLDLTLEFYLPVNFIKNPRLPMSTTKILEALIDQYVGLQENDPSPIINSIDF